MPFKNHKWYSFFQKRKFFYPKKVRKGEVLLVLADKLETLHLALTLSYHLPGVYLKTGFINPLPLSLQISILFAYEKLAHAYTRQYFFPFSTFN